MREGDTMWLPWLSRKKKGLIKEITVKPGQKFGINILAAWRNDKKEVIIMTNDGPIVLNDKCEFFIEVSGGNTDPIKVQVIPDFKNKIFNLLEVIDADAKKKLGTKIVFEKQSDTNLRNLNFGDYIAEWDKNIERYEQMMKRLRFVRNILVPIGIFAIISNLYRFWIIHDFINLSIALLAIFGVYYILRMNRTFYKNYMKYKEIRSQMFGVVKDT